MSGLAVLCVDPDPDELEATRASLESDGRYETRGTSSVADAGDAFEETVDCVVTEYTLPDGTGLDLVADLRDRAPDTPCVLFTDVSPDRIETGNREELVVEYLPKGTPEARSSLVRLVGNVIAERTQVGYPLPDDEDERLAALAQYDRPGLEARETFDRLTALARRYFGVDVSFVGVVDAHEERLLACEGADWETLTREDAICTHTVTGDEVLIVEDTHEDPRFADIDRLDELGIRSYAGAPLTTPRGAVIGAFCLTHDEPRTWSGADRADLRRFADEAIEQLELRRRLGDRDRERGEGDAADRSVDEDDVGAGPSGDRT